MATSNGKRAPWYQRPEIMVPAIAAFLATGGSWLGQLWGAAQWKATIESDVKDARQSALRAEELGKRVEQQQMTRFDRIEKDQSERFARVEKDQGRIENSVKERADRMELAISKLDDLLRDSARSLRR